MLPFVPCPAGSADVLRDVDAPLIHYDQLQGQQLTRKLAATAHLTEAAGTLTLLLLLLGPAGDVAVLVPVKQSVPFMQQLAADRALQQHVKGLLIDDTGADSRAMHTDCPAPAAAAAAPVTAR